MNHDHGQAATAPVGKHGPTAAEDFLKGIWRENPVLVQLLGLCPTLAVTNTLGNSLGMAVATVFVLCCSSVLVSSARKLIPNEVRITGYILIIATFVTIADMMLEALVPVIHEALGAFIALIVVNCIILGRQEAFSAKHGVWRSFLDALGMGLGFTIMLVIMGGVRELLGSGTLLGYSVFGPRFEPWVIMVLPPGGFLTLAGVLLVMGWHRERKAAARPDLAPRTVGAPTTTEPALEPAGV
ncbi:MAG TPA: electron transport complex subunit E [Gemmatimonadaceae bacterium]|nr:electron transport complex subunit E [Gemmatimonadaceae bacterium]